MKNYKICPKNGKTRETIKFEEKKNLLSFCSLKTKKYIILVLTFTEINIVPELHSLPHFRIHGRSPECDWAGIVVAGQDYIFPILYM